MSQNFDPHHLRIVFMGTPEFGATILRALIDSSHSVVGVVTQPDRPVGRKSVLTPPPVKVVASVAGIPVIQVEKLRDPATHAQLAEFGADIFVVASFGLILPVAVLNIPLLRTLNVHASLLPLYRGASPISQSILDGQAETGDTIMLVEKALDAGPMLSKVVEPIRPDDSTASLSARLAGDGAQLLLATLPGWASGEIVPEPQDHAAATYVGMLKKEDGRIDWAKPAAYIERMTRAYDPWPGAFTTWNGQQLRILRGHVVAQTAVPGEVVAVTEAGRHGDLPAVGTGDGALALDLVQLAGKKETSGAEFMRGYRDFIGSVLQ